MNIYHSSLEAIEQVTAQLQRARCRHCRTQGQLVSHGYVQRKSPHGKPPQRVGKRVYCSPRYGRSGCGRTMQLYLACTLVYLHAKGSAVVAFMAALQRGVGIGRAYREATGAQEPRNGFRWLEKLAAMTVVFRAALRLPVLAAPPDASLNRAHPRHTLIVSTFRNLLAQWGSPLCAQFQTAQQRSFIRP